MGYSNRQGDVIIGLDLSLTCTGMSALQVLKEGDTEKLTLIDTKTIPTSKDEDWFTRVSRISTEIIRFVFKYKPSFIFIESYSYGSTNGREIAGEVHGVSIFSLIKEGFPAENIYRVVSPSQLKKFATGKGLKVEKKDVVEYVNTSFGLNLTVKENDIADAIVLAYIGYCIKYYDYIAENLADYQKEVIKKIKKRMEESNL